MSNRGLHPDLTPDGDVRDDAYLSPAQRDFDRMYGDTVQRQVFVEGVARRQSQLPREVQLEVQGKTYGAGRDAFEGYLLYERAIRDAQTYYRPNELTSDDIGRMSIEQYNQAFDERGRPRQGYSFRATGRDVALDSQRLDPSSRQEFRR